MACERIVVATDCGGVKEVVGDAGFLVPPKDSVALATALQQALTVSSDERLQLGKKHVIGFCNIIHWIWLLTNGCVFTRHQ